MQKWNYSDQIAVVFVVAAAVMVEITVGDSRSSGSIGNSINNDDENHGLYSSPNVSSHLVKHTYKQNALGGTMSMASQGVERGMAKGR
jgi:hypothetical protein